MQKICINPNCKKAFKVIEQEQIFCQKKRIPLPDECPSCRHKKRMALRNERNLYARACAKCGEKMISTIPEKAPYTVYCHKCFWDNIG